MSRLIMSTATIQPDLIITLSQDRVSLSMSEVNSKGRLSWQTAFKVDSIFLEEQISIMALFPRNILIFLARLMNLQFFQIAMEI